VLIAAHVRRQLVGVALTALFFGGAVTVPARAERDATLDERWEWADAIRTYDGIADPLPPECVRGTVSDVAAAWGLARLSHAAGCPDSGDGYSVMRRVDLQWEVELQASDQLVCGYVVPRAVGHDLMLDDETDLCRPPQTWMGCLPHRGGSVLLTERPPYCGVPEKFGVCAECGATLTRLRWTHWGRSRASARGHALGIDLSQPPARVLAYRRTRRACNRGDYAYSRVRVTVAHWRHTFRLQTCP
jgi:hypothetical protein